MAAGLRRPHRRGAPQHGNSCLKEASPTGDRPSASTGRVVAAAAIGNALEFYDFIVYGFFAGAIGTAFFPSTDPTSSLLASYATFGVSFLARPLGAVVLGRYADRRGSRSALSASIALMTIGTAMIALTPGQRSIGIAAPLLVIAARLIQGFSLGGEYGAATMTLIAHRPARAVFLASFQPTSQYAAAAFASGLGFALSAALPHAAYVDFGFRIAFAVGTLIGPIGLLIRRRIDNVPGDHAGSRPARVRPDRERLANLAIGAASIAVGTGVTYVGIYLPIYAETVLHMRAGSGLAAVAIAYVLIVPISIVAGRTCENLKRLRTMAISTVLLMVAVIPLFALIGASPHVGTLIGMRLALAILAAPYLALQPVMLAALFPTRDRVAGMALAYTLGVVVFGAFAPFMSAWSVRATGDPRAPALVIVLTGLVTLAALAAAAIRSATDGTPARTPAPPRR